METRMNMPRHEAITLIADTLKYTPTEELVSLPDAVDRVAARDILSNLNVPDVRCSRWDGISFSFEHYTHCGSDVSNWKTPEDYIFTNTGIPLFRDEFDTMVMIEHTSFDGEQLCSINQPDVIQGQNVIPVGERMTVGECLVEKGALIRPSHLNLLATGGVVLVPVLRKPIVAVLTSGNELVSCWNTPVPGQTIESNSLSMCAKIRQWGGQPLRFPITRDSTTALQERLTQAAQVADLIVIGGGSGRGQFDLLQKATASAGTLFFSSVEHGPGKRTCFALIDNTPVLGLVGPPGGEEMTFDFYVMPAVKACLGQTYRVTTVQAVLEEDIPPHTRTDFYYTMLIRRASNGKTLFARPLPHFRLDRSIADHNGYLFIRKDSAGYARGEIATVEVRTGYENI